MKKKLIPSLFGLALLILLILIARSSRSNAIAACFASLSLALLVWVYYLLSVLRDITTRKQVEVELQQSEEKFRQLAENIHEVFWLSNADISEILYVSLAYEQIWGRSCESLYADPQSFLSAIHPDDRQYAIDNIEHCTNGEFDIEYRIIRPDGSVRWIRDRGFPILNESGEIYRRAGIAQDITQRKQTESILQQRHEELEIRVTQRTAELIEANERLQCELFKREKVERALRESEERWQLAIRGTNDGIWDWNIKTDEAFFSARWKEMLGYEDHEIGNNSDEWRKRIHPDDLEGVMQLYQDHVSGKTPFYTNEHRLLCKDGTYKWILARGQMLWDVEGNPLRMAGSHTDISDAKAAATLRKRAEAERTKLIAILEATPDIVATVSLDERICYLNSAARQVFGLGENDDCTNLTICDVQPDWVYEILCNEGYPTAVRDGVWVGETAFLSHDGREIPVSQLIIAHKSPDGRVNMFSTIARDISQQKQIAASLVEAERRWRSLLENVRLVVVGLDNKGRVEYVNPCFLELVGYSQAEVIGQDWFETFLPQHQKKQMQNNFIELLEREFYIHNHNAILTKSGEERVIAWNNTLLQNVQGYVIGTLSIGEDITERQVIQRMKDEFISVVSHELRTPLTSIHGAMNLISSGLIDTESDKGRRVIEIAAESAERLVRIVNDILELERLESGKISLLKQTCNAQQLMLKAIEMMQVMANRAGITLSASPQIIQCVADPDRIIQVLTNLLDNAIKFSSRGSTVWISVKQVIRDKELAAEEFPISNFSVLFQVKDQGRGIPEDKLDSIFERFHQVDASDARKKGGTGLGLAICRSIVQQHGGRIWVESTVDEGSSFYFTLPGQ